MIRILQFLTLCCIIWKGAQHCLLQSAYLTNHFNFRIGPRAMVTLCRSFKININIYLFILHPLDRREKGRLMALSGGSNRLGRNVYNKMGSTKDTKGLDKLNLPPESKNSLLPGYHTVSITPKSFTKLLLISGWNRSLALGLNAKTAQIFVFTHVTMIVSTHVIIYLCSHTCEICLYQHTCGNIHEYKHITPGLYMFTNI